VPRPPQKRPGHFVPTKLLAEVSKCVGLRPASRVRCCWFRYYCFPWPRRNIWRSDCVPQNPPAAPIAQPAPAASVRTVASGFWRAVALISLSLLVGVAVTVALRWQRDRRGSYAVS